jgi:DNA (cytosine-5)-methyltransferase 1
VRYLSVCSGIEAATVAWHPLGWTPVGFSEIEAFPSAVLAHHYPDITNYGDMTKHESWPITRGAIDLLVGGTPCQSFSVAGLRKGLKDPRGGLMLTYLEIAQRLRPRWVVWENVPGVLSSNGGRDFGAFLGALGELGYGWAYRVLDAQWVRTQRHPRAVPQRRRRVFVIGRLIERGAGDSAAAAAVLFERESVRRDTAARRTKGQGVAADAEGGTATGSWAMQACGTLNAANQGPASVQGQDDLNGQLIVQRVSGTLGTRGVKSHTELDGHGAYVAAIQGNLVGRDTGGPHGVGASEEGAMYTLTKADTHAVAFHPTQDPISSADGSTHCMGTGTKQGHATIAVAHAMTVRRLTPRECERLQGFPDDYTAIPWRGKAETPDGPRYKALGNSMAVNCMEWIGERIATQEAA